MVEHGAPQVRGDALAEPRHEIEARIGRQRHHDHDDQHHRERAVELGGVAGGEAAIDDEFQALPDRQHRGRREQQRDAGENHLLAVWPQEAADAGERLQRRHRRQLWGVDGNCGVGTGHGVFADDVGQLREIAVSLALPPAKVEPVRHPIEGRTPCRLALPALMTLLAVLWYVVTIQVGRARTKYKVAAPAITGDPAFERAYRVQMNTLEQLVAFLPAMWIYAWYGNPRWAAVACAVWIVGRIIYAFGYWADENKRGLGFGISFIALAVIWVAALVSVVRWLGFA